MKLLKLGLSVVLMGAVAVTSGYASVEKGKKIYMKKLKAPCGFTGAKFAIKHTQDEWEAIMKAGKFKEEIKKICPKVMLKRIRDKYIQDLYDFSYEFASDSGKVPTC